LGCSAKNESWRRQTSRAALASVLLAAWVAPNSTESAVANGDTRTVSFTNRHTNEDGSFTYMVNGVYDQAVLDKLNWFMRDWRLNEPTKMDPKLFDIIWEVYRESGSQQPIEVLSAYRSPQTNAMLRRRSRQVAEHSQHMEGRAIDAHFLDVGTARIRDIAMRMEEGGVGFYPVGMTPWVHIDSGSVRYWPRMSREALTRLFPDGKTVFIPSDGQPMPGYDLAKAEIEQRGGQVQTASNGGIFAWLFGSRGGGADDAEEAGGQEAIVASHGGGRAGGRSGGGETAPTPGSVEVADAGPAAVAKAKQDLPTGPAYASPAPSAPTPATAPSAASAPAAEPVTQSQVVAALEQPKAESDAASDSPVELKGPIAALFLAPLPPRRPANLEQQLLLLADIPLPPVRPTDLAPSQQNAPASAPLPPIRPAHLAALAPEPIGAPDTTASISVGVAPARPPEVAAAKAAASEPASWADERTQLPGVITRGVNPPQPTSALALAETSPSPVADDSALLERASELTAPLPPMPIPNAEAAPPVAPTAHVEHKTGFVAEVARLFGVFGSESDSDEQR
jgi:uncharacterized protein YcbK (DUF882 family)